MTVQEAAKILELSPRSVYALCAAGKIRHRRVGLNRGAIRLDRRDVEVYRDGGIVVVAPPSVSRKRGKLGSGTTRLDGKPNRHF